jgi:hypothetical protein
MAAMPWGLTSLGDDKPLLSLVEQIATNMGAFVRSPIERKGVVRNHTDSGRPSGGRDPERKPTV